MSTIKKRNEFPCPVCKGHGGYTDVVLDDGTGPYYPCYGCDDEGFIVIGSPNHRRYFFSSRQWFDLIYKFQKPLDLDLGGQELKGVGTTLEQDTLIGEIASKLEELWDSMLEPNATAPTTENGDER